MHNEMVACCGLKEVKKWHVNARMKMVFATRARSLFSASVELLFQEAQVFRNLVVKVYKGKTWSVS